MFINRLVVISAAGLIIAACDGRGDSAEGQQRQPEATDAGRHVTRVTAARLEAADTETGNWLTHGRTYDEQRFSPLDEIDKSNVADLGLAWYFDVPTQRGMEATPIVVDGRRHVTGSWSIVYALDAASGKVLWR